MERKDGLGCLTLLLYYGKNGWEKRGDIEREEGRRGCLLEVIEGPWDSSDG